MPQGHLAVGVLENAVDLDGIQVAIPGIRDIPGDFHHHLAEIILGTLHVHVGELEIPDVGATLRAKRSVGGRRTRGKLQVRDHTASSDHQRGQDDQRNCGQGTLSRNGGREWELIGH